VDVADLAGQDLGYSEWMEITQEQVDRFAAATGDHQWIHVDRERAEASRFGATIAQGFLVLSLTSRVLAQVLRVPGAEAVINYRCDWVRFLSPVPVGSQLRARVRVRTVEPVRGGVRLSLGLTFLVKGRRAPVCIGRIAVHAYPDGWAAGPPPRRDEARGPLS
jgi:acyl dehydratase